MANEASGPTYRQNWAANRAQVRTRSISTSQADWVSFGEVQPGESLPRLVSPAMKNVELSAWAGTNFALLEEQLARHGGLLFRGFELSGQEGFERFLNAIPVALTGYIEGATPRTRLGQKVYSSTEFPPEHAIAPHNELSYVTSWPMKIFFFCVKAAAGGGETPIADVRRVYERIDPRIRDTFRDKGWMLVRNFREGFGPTWQKSYQTEDKEQVESYFRQAAIDFEWLDGGQLRTRQVRPAIARHPHGGELVWFNHVAFWHVSSLEPGTRAMLLEAGEENLPYNTYYGDGSRIEDEVAAHLREAYQAELRMFAWHPGDLLMLDNMLVAHGRSPFQGERKILAAMGEPCSERGV